MVAALGTSGCSNLSAGENAAILGGLAGAATGIALGTTGVPASSAVPIALGAAAGGAALGYGISKMQSNRDQRTFAEQRGATLVQRAQRQGNVEIPRYILVDTIAERPSSNPNSRPVMIYDTTTGRVSSNRVYFVNEAPGSGGFIPLSPEQARSMN